MDKNNETGGAKLSLHSIGSLFSDTWKLYKERFSTLVEIVLLPVLVTMLGYILLGLGFPFSAIGGLVIFVGAILFVFTVLPVIFSIHNTAGVDASYRSAIRWFWPFVWIAILEILAMFGGFVMLVVPGIWLIVSFAFVAYVLVIEQRRGIDALRQSKAYIKGYWWAITGRAILIAILYCVGVMILEVPAGLIAGRIGAELASMAAVLFFVPFSAIYYYNIFMNLRDLKPELASVQTKEGTGFIKASAIVGIVAPVLIIIILIIFVGVGLFSARRNVGSYGSLPGSGAQNY